MNENFTIGIDLGGTAIKGLLLDSSGIIRKEMAVETLDDSDDSDGTRWKGSINNLLQSLGNDLKINAELAGLSAPGLASPDNRRIISMPKRLHGLENFDPGKFLGLDTYVLNDAHAHLIAESKYGAGKGYKNIVMMTLGTGVGGAIMIDGELYQGEIGRAGHIGHISINQTEMTGITGTPGSLEMAVGEYTVQERTNGKFETTHELVKAYLQGDKFATQVWLQSLENLARGIISIINIISPQLIILGGGITEAGEALIKPLKKYLDAYEWRPGGYSTEIKIASKGRFGGALGAATFALARKQEHKL